MSKKKNDPHATPTNDPQTPDNAEAQRAKTKTGLVVCWSCGGILEEAPSAEKPVALCPLGHPNLRRIQHGRRAQVLDGKRWQVAYETLRNGGSKRDAFEAAGISDRTGYGWIARGIKEKVRLAQTETEEEQPLPAERPYLDFAILFEETWLGEKIDLLSCIRDAAKGDPEVAKYLLQLRWRDEFREPTGELNDFKMRLIEVLLNVAVEFIPVAEIPRFTARLLAAADSLVAPGTGARAKNKGEREDDASGTGGTPPAPN